MTRNKRVRPVSRVEDVLTRCSFCGKPHSEAAKVIAGPGVYICDVCTELCHRIIGESSSSPDGHPHRMHRGPDPRSDQWIAGMTDDDLLAALPRQLLTLDQAERDLRAWVRVLRDRGVSWARIGEALGISRQAAWDRFAGDIRGQ